MNLAALWKLPVLFLCENNLYAMGTHVARHQAQTDIAAKAAGYGMPGEALDGMDVRVVETAVRAAADAVRSGKGPMLLELRTYRFRAHSMYDAELYRGKDEVEEWKNRDPIATFETLLRTEGLMTDADRAAAEQETAGLVAEAVAFAEAGPWEPVEDLLKDVYTSPMTPGGRRN
jgi:TPP-dependent pyruvate/acetoin dehydrogenase alpha subunit